MIQKNSDSLFCIITASEAMTETKVLEEKPLIENITQFDKQTGKFNMYQWPEVIFNSTMMNQPGGVSPFSGDRYTINSPVWTYWKSLDLMGKPATNAISFLFLTIENGEIIFER